MKKQKTKKFACIKTCRTMVVYSADRNDCSNYCDEASIHYGGWQLLPWQHISININFKLCALN